MRGYQQRKQQYRNCTGDADQYEIKPQTLNEDRKQHFDRADSIPLPDYEQNSGQSQKPDKRRGKYQDWTNYSVNIMRSIEKQIHSEALLG